ncbi:MAG: mechanosensitive ion channel [Sphingobium sp.]|uniref:mechanosensitive ion channel family protein n=1 Tax=Sphingobium sp. TaxID=1912891 RepID=UPI0029B9C826|nr:mechanosensitive ion channel domain-containing protein [Sphingobium sp.]MDX3909975.1 mechanosensitive ion channel [Sphingobium sp.]
MTINLYELTYAGISLGLLLSVALGVVIALAIHWMGFAIASRVAARSSGNSDDILVAASRAPARWLLVLLAVGAALQPFRPLPQLADTIWSIGSKMIFAALLGWLALNLLRAGREIVEAHSDITVEDNLKARRRHTRVRILYRIAQIVIGFVAISLMLIAIPGVRTIGVTLMASAGLVGLAVGAAAQPALKNLIAGIQMAFSEPIRLDDVVIVEGEWGRVEDIKLTYVVVRIWDDRRLVVPVSWFLEKPFQNWTLQTSDLLGTVFFYVDPEADVQRIRDKFIAATEASPRWDKRVAILQVTEQRSDALELRGLLSARNAGVAFDLRCEVREAVMAFLRTEMPEALPRGRQRLEHEGDTPPRQGAAPVIARQQQ